MDNELDPQAVNLAKAIRQVESGGNFQSSGKSGEYGAYQFMPATWAMASKKFLGQDVPLQSATPEQQNEVAYKQIKEWKDAGHNVGEIASMWNAGPGKPQAYLEGNRGKNNLGVSYDTQAYANRVADAYQNIKGQGEAPQGGVAGAVERGIAGAPETRTLGQKLGGELSYALGNANQETPTGLSSVFQGGKEMLSGNVSGGLGDVGLGLLDVGGAAGGAVNDIIGAGVGALIDKFVPDSVKSATGKVMQDVFSTPEVRDALTKANQWIAENPKKAHAAGDIFNIITGLIPAVKTASAVKNLITGGVTSELAASQAGQAVLSEAKGEGIDAIGAAKNIIDEAPTTFISKVRSAVGLSPKHYVSDLMGFADDAVANSQKELVGQLAKEGIKTNLSDVAYAAEGLAKDAFQGDGGVRAALSKAFGRGLNEAADVPLSRMAQYAFSDGANPYVREVVQTILKQEGSQAVNTSAQKIAEATIAKKVFASLLGYSEKPGMIKGALASGAEAAGTTIGANFGSGGAYAGNKMGEAIAKRFLGNNKGLISEALLKNATRGSALKSAAKSLTLPALANIANRK